MATDEFDQLIEQMSEQAWRNMRQAVETGRWPDGRALQQGQRELCMQALIAWEARHLPEEERTGYLRRADCGSQSQEQPVTLREAGQGGRDA